jgi:hypothetical protein
MMGIMMPETCWDRSFIINISLVASCWFLCLHPMFMMHGHKNIKIVPGSLHENLRIFMIISLWILPRMKNVSDKFVEKMKIRILCSASVFPKIVAFIRLCRKIWYRQRGSWWKHNRVHAHCMMDNQGYKYRPRLFNTYCLPTTTMVARTRLNIKLYVHCLSCSFPRLLSSHSSER